MAAQNGLLFGRYRLVREMERTEAGTLYEAFDAHGNQFEAGKMFAVEMANALPDDAAKKHFLRDARLSERLTGMHVLRALKVGTLENGTPCVVREPSYSDLQSEVEAHGSVPLAQAVEWTLELCEALAEGHAIGVAHGDVRPANVMLATGENGPIVKLCWTSAAKADGVVKEDIARDIQGAAGVLRVLATGVIGSVAEADQAPTLPQGVSGIVARALSSESPYTNIGELARALEPYAPAGSRSAKHVSMILARSGVVGTPLPIAAPARPAAESVGDDWFEHHPDHSAGYDSVPAKKQWPVLALVAGLVFVASAGTYAAWRSGVQEDLPRLAAPQQVNSDDTKTNEQALRTTQEGIDDRSGLTRPNVAKPAPPPPMWNPVTNEPVGHTTVTSAPAPTEDVPGLKTEAPTETSPAPAPVETSTPTE